MNGKDLSHYVRFRLSLTSEKYLAYYKGKAQSIAVRSIDNKSIRFPANAVRQYLTHDGINGLFEIEFDENNTLVKIEQISN